MSACRVDVFPDTGGGIPRADMHWIDGMRAPVVLLNDILDHKLGALVNCTSDAPVDPKYWQDVQALAQVLGLPVPAVPEQHLRSATYSTDFSVVCPRCETSRTVLFPLAAKALIFAIPGYV